MSQTIASAPTPPATQTAQKQNPSTRIHLVSGASAGLISAVTLQPLDLLKTRLQQQQKTNLGYRTTLTNELRKLSKFKDLWRGALPSTLRTLLGAGLYFTILSQLRSYIATYKQQKQTLLLLKHQHGSTSVLPRLLHMENLLSGSIVRALVGFITMPITIIKTRFESNMYNYNSMYEGFEGIYNDGGKGSWRNFFKGLLATLARDCPYAGLYVLFYESFKNELMPAVLAPFSLDDVNRGTVTNSAAAVLAASVSTTLTAPFDAIKTRLQLTTPAVGGPPIHSSLWLVTKCLVAEEGGVRNLFRGLSLRFGRKGLSAGISWCIYEELLKLTEFNRLLVGDKKLA